MTSHQSGLEYALTLWPDTRGDSITREEAAQVVEKWSDEVHYLPCSLSADFQEGWEAACETIALALRIRDMTLTPPRKAVQMMDDRPKPREITPALLDEFVRWTQTATLFTTSPQGEAFGAEMRAVIDLARRQLDRDVLKGGVPAGPS